MRGVLMAGLLVSMAAMAQQPPGPPPGGAPMKAAPGPSLELALQAAQVALSTCVKQGYVVGVTVVDSAGIQKVVLGADGAPALAMTSSLQKAATAAALSMPTSAAAEKVKSDPAFAAEVKAKSNLLTIAGGVPIIVKGTVIGGVGAGGGPSSEEEKCAQKGVDAIISKL